MAGCAAPSRPADTTAREGFPTRDDGTWLRHTLALRHDDGRVRLAHRPAYVQPLSREVASIPPKERVVPSRGCSWRGWPNTFCEEETLICDPTWFREQPSPT